MFTSEQKRLLDKLSQIDDIEQQLDTLLDQTKENLQQIREIESNIHKIVEEKTKGFPWLADAIAQYCQWRDLKIAEFLQHKLRPAIQSAERVREIAKEKRILEKKFRITRNLIRYYEALFPWLPEFIGEDVDYLIEQALTKKVNEDSQDDPVKFYLTEGEYKSLTITERNQRALDRYWSKKKNSWEIGRDYERYIGYLYESEGYSVYYQGIEEGLEDLGRDLIAIRNGQQKVIQCKYWAKHKTIHEKHICQLFGTTLKYWLEHKQASKRSQMEFWNASISQSQIKGVFVTSTNLSDVAKEFANELGVEVKEEFPFEKYPSIKCNISRKTGEKIYHLPIDQQYDRTIIEYDRDECYVETVAEAEELGFRRAWRWRGDN